ncbi:MAG: methyltransferase family protein, partial [Candidatus Thorarchaeota archaeon]
LNSLFLLVYSIAYLLILVPVILYYEEKDLVKRFGNSYVQYQKTTGALIPKFWKRKKKDST